MVAFDNHPQAFIVACNLAMNAGNTEHIGSTNKATPDEIQGLPNNPWYYDENLWHCWFCDCNTDRNIIWRHS